MSFKFGAPAGSDAKSGGFSFNTNAPAPSFAGTGKADEAKAGFSFGAAPAPASTTAQAPAPSFLGGASKTTESKPTQFSFGSSSDAPAFGSTTPANSGAAPPFGSSKPADGSATSKPFPFPGTDAQTTADAKLAFGFGAAKTDESKTADSSATPAFGSSNDKGTAFSSAPSASASSKPDEQKPFPFSGTEAKKPSDAKTSFSFSVPKVDESKTSAFNFATPPDKKGPAGDSSDPGTAKPAFASPPATADAKATPNMFATPKGGNEKASGGFSFGGTDKDKGTPAPAAGAASFAAKDDKAGAATAGGFSFNTRGDKTAPTPATATTPAAAATPGDKATATPGPATTPASTAATPAPVQTPATPATAQPPRIEYQTLTVEQIINKFQAELEKDVVVHVNEAHRVAKMDAVLRDSQRSLSLLTNETSRLFVQQSELSKELEGIAAFQSELGSSLDLMEHQVDELFASQAHVMPLDGDVERERAYATAQNLEQRLSTLQESLDVSLRLPKAQGPLGDILQILSDHQDGLAQLQHAARTMEQDVTQLERVLQR